MRAASRTSPGSPLARTGLGGVYALSSTSSLATSAGTLLHRRHAEPPTVADARVAIGHVDQGPFGARYNRADIKPGTLVDEWIDRKAEEILAAFGLENRGDGGGRFHGCGPTACLS